MICGSKKMGEYNMLVCVAAPHPVGSYPNDGHCYVVADKPKVRLPIAILPDKRKGCCCTPETCVCAPKKKVDKRRGSGRIVRK